jgi:hypothetical protein
MLLKQGQLQVIFYNFFHKVKNSIHPNFELMYGKNYANNPKISLNFLLKI